MASLNKEQSEFLGETERSVSNSHSRSGSVTFSNKKQVSDLIAKKLHRDHFMKATKILGDRMSKEKQILQNHRQALREKKEKAQSLVLKASQVTERVHKNELRRQQNQYRSYR